MGAALAAQLAAFAQKVRAMDLRKAPSIAETIDWARALLLLGASALDREVVRSTLGVIVKHEDDRAKVEAKLADAASELEPDPRRRPSIALSARRAAGRADVARLSSGWPQSPQREGLGCATSGTLG